MDLSTVVRYYVDKALKEVPGMKVLLLDAETTKIVSTVYSQSEILEQEVYLVEQLDVERKEQLLHLKVSCQSTFSCVSLSKPHQYWSLIWELCMPINQSDRSVRYRLCLQTLSMALPTFARMVHQSGYIS